MTVVAVKLDDSIFQELERASGTVNLSADQLISRIVENYLHLEKVNKLRQELNGVAEAAGFLTEEDLFREIS